MGEFTSAQVTWMGTLVIVAGTAYLLLFKEGSLTISGSQRGDPVNTAAHDNLETYW